MANEIKSQAENVFKRSFFFIGFLVKEIRYSVKFFLGTKKGVLLFEFLIKFGNTDQKSFIISFIGFFLPKITRSSSGYSFIVKLFRYISQEDKKTILEILSNCFIKWIFSRYFSQIIDFIYQCFFSKKEKEFFIFYVIFKKNLNLSLKHKQFFFIPDSLRLIWSGFSEHAQSKIAEIFRRNIYFFLERISFLSLVIVQTSLWNILRIYSEKFYFQFEKIDPTLIIFMNNSLHGLFVGAQLLKKYGPKKMLRTANFLSTYFQCFMKNKYGHILILSFFSNKNFYEIITNRKKLSEKFFSSVQLSSRFHRICYLFILRPHTRFFLNKKIYRFLKISNFKKKSNFPFFHFNQKWNFSIFLSEIIKTLFEKNCCGNLFHLVARELLRFSCFKAKNQKKHITGYWEKFCKIQLEKGCVKLREKMNLFGSFKITNKRSAGKYPIMFYSFIFKYIRNFKGDKKHFLQFFTKRIFFSLNKKVILPRGKKNWKTLIRRPLNMSSKCFLLAEKLIRNKKNY